MVCYGPSKGCKRCRQRKIKCDERKPGCRNCEKSKRECPGYDRGAGILSFKDETSTIHKQSQQSSPIENVPPAFPATTSGAGLENTPIKFASPSKHAQPAPSKRKKPAGLSLSKQHGPDTSPIVLANEIIPLGVPADPEQQSLSFFLSKFAHDADRSEEIWGGFLEALPALLEKAPSKSPLAAAASTTAMASMAWTPGYSEYRQQALGKYVTSLKRINDALKDPKQAKSDNLLMAVLMLGFYENIKTLTLQRSDREAHIKGAVALIKARKPGSFKSPNSLRLFLAVRAQLLNLCIEKSDPAPFEDFNSATEGTIPKDFIPSAADRLVMLSEDLPHLLQQEQQMLALVDPVEQCAAAESLMTQCLQVEELLAYWATMVPPQFQYTSIPLPQHEGYIGSSSQDFYPANMDIYCDNTMASTWNTWRITRMRILRITMHCLDITNPPHPAIPRPPEYTTALSTIHHLIDDICSSVPFHLGFHEHRVGDQGAFSLFPHPPGEAKWPDNFAASGAVGGWLMMQPLSFVARLEFTPSSQQAWVREYLTTFLRDPRDMGRVPISPPSGDQQ